MSDLVRRLRECAHRAAMHYFKAPIYNEAADEIERLEKEVNGLRGTLSYLRTQAKNGTLHPQVVIQNANKVLEIGK